MASLSIALGKWLIGIGAALVALVVGLLAFSRLRAFALRLGPYLAIPAIIGLLILAVVLQRSYPPSSWGRRTRLPDEFLDGYWAWIVVLLLGAVASAVAFVWATRRSSRGLSGRQSEERFPEVEAAWDEIALRFERAGIVPEEQLYYLILAPDEDEVRALVESAEVQVFATAPDGPSPLRAFATADGVLLGCVGASGLGRGDLSGPARLEALCRRLVDLRPDAPPVRGVAVALPVPWLDRPELSTDATAVREDLRAVRRALGLRCPVFVLFTAMDRLPGFLEFIARMAATGVPQVLAQRVGFAVPRSEPFSGDLARRGMVWMSGWLHDWILSLLAADPLNAAGNERLITLDLEFLRRRKRFCSALEAALSAHRGSEPPLFRGCYFVANGGGRGQQAFATGLLRGPRGRIPADHVATSWSDAARDGDRRHVRMAVTVAVVVGALCLLIWAAIIGRTPRLGGLGLLILAATWVLVLLRLPRR